LKYGSLERLKVNKTTLARCAPEKGPCVYIRSEWEQDRGARGWKGEWKKRAERQTYSRSGWLLQLSIIAKVKVPLFGNLIAGPPAAANSLLVISAPRMRLSHPEKLD
jgi:hypothetical protein